MKPAGGCWRPRPWAAEFDSLVITPVVDKVKSVIRMFCNRVTCPDLYSGSARDAPMHMLLHGPPGTGKTWLAECAAREVEKAATVVNRPFKLFRIDRGDFDCGIERAFKRISALFTAAADPESITVIVLDECDAVMNKKSRVLSNTFKSAWQQHFSRADAILLGQTNHFDVINEGIKDRFAHHFEVELPTAVQIRAHIVQTLGNQSALSPAEFDALAQRFSGISVRAVRSRCQNVVLMVANAASEARRAGLSTPLRPILFSDFGGVSPDESVASVGSAQGNTDTTMTGETSAEASTASAAAGCSTALVPVQPLRVVASTILSAARELDEGASVRFVDRDAVGHTTVNIATGAHSSVTALRAAIAKLLPLARVDETEDVLSGEMMAQVVITTVEDEATAVEAPAGVADAVAVGAGSSDVDAASHGTPRRRGHAQTCAPRAARACARAGWCTARRAPRRGAARGASPLPASPAQPWRRRRARAPLPDALRGRARRRGGRAGEAACNRRLPGTAPTRCIADQRRRRL